MEPIQNAGMRIILEAPRTVTGTEMRQKLDWTTLAQRRKLHTLKAEQGLESTYLHHKFRFISDLSDRQTRALSSGKLYLKRLRTEYSAAKLWNSLLPSRRTLQAPGPFIKACNKTALSRGQLVSFFF